MTVKTKLWLITAALLILTGLIIFGGVMTVLKWDFTKLSTHKYETNEHMISESFTNISVTTKTADVTFAPTDKDIPYVVCHEQKNLSHTVAVTDGTLNVEIHDTRKWYEYIGINFGAPKITVYLPKGSYGLCTVKTSTGDLMIPSDFSFDGIDVSGSTGDVKCYATATGDIKIKLSTGHINLENLSALSLDLTVSTGHITASGINCSGDIKAKVSTGRINLTDVNCKSLVSDGDTGDMNLKNVIATEKFDIERDTGDVKFEGCNAGEIFVTTDTGDVKFDSCDAGELFITTDTGDVKGTLLSEKIFIPRSKTGKIDAPKTVNGGRCEVNTDTGDIIISLITK